MSLASVSKTATSSALVWAYCYVGEPTVKTQSQWEYHTHTQRWKRKRPFLPADNYSILARHFARSNRAAPGKLWVSVTVIFVELIIGMQGGWNESHSRNEEVQKKGEDGRGRRLRCHRTVWRSWGVSGGMLIGLWALSRSKSTPRSGSWPGLTLDPHPTPPHPPNTHSHLTTHKARPGGEGERGSERRTMCDYDCVHKRSQTEWVSFIFMFRAKAPAG